MRTVLVSPLDEAVRHEAFALRSTVWAGLGQCVPALWRDDLDDHPDTQLLVTQQPDGRVVATSRVTRIWPSAAPDNVRHVVDGTRSLLQRRDRPFAFFSRLVVAPTHRGQGLSRQHDALRERFVDSHWADVVTLTLTTDGPRVIALLSAGWTVVAPCQFQHGGWSTPPGSVIMAKQLVRA